MVKKLMELFIKKELQKISQKEFRTEKVNEKETSYMSNEKSMIIHLIVRL